MEHHIHKAEEVLDHTVALHYIRIPGIEAMEALGADTLEEEDFEDLVALVGAAARNTGILPENTTDTVAEVAVQIGLHSRNQDQWVDE